MLEFFANLFGDNVGWAVFFVSLIPGFESKVAIPFGITQQVWGSATLSPLMSGLFAFLGSILPCILVIFLFKHFKSNRFFNKVANSVEHKNQEKFDQIQKKSSVWKKCIFLATFVAIPLPLTGVYTGGIIAGLSNLKIWQGFLAVMVGELISCAIIVMLCTIFENSVFYIFLISIILCLACLVFTIINSMISKRKNK